MHGTSRTGGVLLCYEFASNHLMPLARQPVLSLTAVTEEKGGLILLAGSSSSSRVVTARRPAAFAVRPPATRSASDDYHSTLDGRQAHRHGLRRFLKQGEGWIHVMR